jgi:hypothetical protein
MSKSSGFRIQLCVKSRAIVFAISSLCLNEGKREQPISAHSLRSVYFGINSSDFIHRLANPEKRNAA